MRRVGGLGGGEEEEELVGHLWGLRRTLCAQTSFGSSSLRHWVGDDEGEEGEELREWLTGMDCWLVAAAGMEANRTRTSRSVVK